MWSLLRVSVLLLVSFFSGTVICKDRQDAKSGSIVRARLEVKAFIRELLPHYHDVKIKYIPGKDPTMIFLDAENKAVLEEDVSEKSKEEICQILEKHGMAKSKEARSEVPEEPWEDEPEEPDEPWEEEEDRDLEDEEGTEWPETEEFEEEEEGGDTTEHTEL